MKRHSFILAATTAAALAFAAQASAQTAPVSPMATGNAGITGSADAGAWLNGKSANDLIGKSVYNAAGERIGEIDDLIVDKAGTAASTSAVVGVGGFLGVGERKVAVPLNRLDFRDNRLTAATLSKDSVSNMPEYKAGSDTWMRYDRTRPFNLSSRTSADTGVTVSSNTPSSATLGVSGANRAAVGLPGWAKGLAASELIGKAVQNVNGERIGEVDDLVVDKASGKASAVVGVGGLLGIGERKVVVPLSDLEMQGKVLTSATLSKDSVKAMTEYRHDDNIWTRLNRSMTLGG